MSPHDVVSVFVVVVVVVEWLWLSSLVLTLTLDVGAWDQMPPDDGESLDQISSELDSSETL